MDVTADTLEIRLAGRIRQLRTARGLTMDELARASGVSRSAISLIERAETSATAAVLDRLAGSLGVSLAALFTDPADGVVDPVSRADQQETWRDPETGYTRRNLSPRGVGSAIELAEVMLPPGAHVAYDTGPRAAPLDQQVWVLDGQVEITAGDARYTLRTGDCLAMRIDTPTSFRNRGKVPVYYLVAITTGRPA